jgi:hypothetical protein
LPVSDGVLAGGADAVGNEAAISSCGTDLSAAAPIAGASLCADVLPPGLVPDVVLSGAADASGIDDGAMFPIVALLAVATFDVGSLGSMLALAGVMGAA